MKLTDIKKRSFEEIKKSKLEKYKIFKPIKKYDIEIRTIEEEINEERKEVYFIVEVGLYESLGEQGDIITLFYDNIPKEEEIIKDTIKYLKRNLKKLKEDFALSYREEQHLKVLKGLEL